MATIYDVAARAGVSPATVSRVFNGVKVSEEKAGLVRAAAEELAFVPNRAARTLRRQNSELIALIIPDIENPFFTSMARGVEDVAHAAGFSVVLCNTDEDVAKETRYLQIALSEKMAGVILAAAGESSDISEFVSRKRPVVAVDRAPHRLDIDAVLVDGRVGGRTATRVLADEGYRRIACITGPADVETAQRRAEGWADVVGPAIAGTAAVDYLRHTDYRVQGGRAAMRALLELPEPPDAVFAANNLIGVGAIQVLVERGLTPPAVGLAVFGDLPFAALAPSGITVVHTPSRHLGESAARLLLERIGGDDQPPRTIMLRSRVEERPGSSLEQVR